MNYTYGTQWNPMKPRRPAMPWRKTIWPGATRVAMGYPRTWKLLSRGLPRFGILWLLVWFCWFKLRLDVGVWIVVWIVVWICGLIWKFTAHSPQYAVDSLQSTVHSFTLYSLRRVSVYNVTFFYSFTALQFYSFTVLQFHSFTVLQFYSGTQTKIHTYVTNT